MKISVSQRNLGGPVRRRGQYYLRHTKWGMILSKWPAKRTKRYTPANFYKQTEFGIAASEATNPDPGLYDAAVVSAKGSGMVPRDFLVASAYGTHTDFTFEDGSIWVRYRDVTVNAQLVLDQVTDTVGAMMYRAPQGWVEIMPGSNGQFLNVTDSVPTWRTVGAPGAPVPLLSTPCNQNPGGTGNVAVNSLTGSFHALMAGTVVTGIAFYAAANAATSHVQGGLWYIDYGVSNPRKALAPSITGVTKGWNLRPFSAQWLVDVSGIYCAGLQVNTALFSQWIQTPTFASWAATNASPPPDPLNITAIAGDNTKAHCYLY